MYRVVYIGCFFGVLEAIETSGQLGVIDISYGLLGLIDSW